MFFLFVIVMLWIRMKMLWVACWWLGMGVVFISSILFMSLYWKLLFGRVVRLLMV